MGHPLVHLESGAREHLRGEELAGTENRRRLKGRLGQGGGRADPRPIPTTATTVRAAQITRAMPPVRVTTHLRCADRRLGVR